MPLIIYVKELHYRCFTKIKIRLYVAVLKNNRSGKFYNILRKYKLALLAIRSQTGAFLVILQIFSIHLFFFPGEV